MAKMSLPPKVTTVEHRYDSFQFFPRLPFELQTLIWELAFDSRKGRFVFPVLQCVSHKDSRFKCRHKVRAELEESPYCATHVIRGPIHPLLSVCQRSRVIAQKAYIDIGTGGLFDRSRDILVTVEPPALTYYRCPNHNTIIYGESLDEANQWTHWEHTEHVLCYIRWNRTTNLNTLGMRKGRDLRSIVRSQAGGTAVKTITILTNPHDRPSGVTGRFELEWFRKYFMRCWTRLSKNAQQINRVSAIELIWLDDAGVASGVARVIKPHSDKFSI